MGIRERGRRAVRHWTAAATLLGMGITGVASVGTYVAIESAAATTSTSTTTGSTTSAAATGTGTSSSGLSTGSGSSMTSSSGS